MQDSNCFSKAIYDHKPNYVIHNASPFFDEVVDKGDTEDRI